jgi:uncharacterized protein (TIGR00369 family)
VVDERDKHWRWIKDIENRSHFGRLLGIEVVDLAPGSARLKMPVEEKLTQPYEAVHGGAIATLADSAAAAALLSLTDTEEKVATVEMKVNFLAPVRSGELVAEGRVVHKGERLAVLDVDVRNDGDTLIAKALITYIIIR